MDNQDSKRRWGTDQRLEFIEFRLFWEGGVNRSDITDHFGVSVPQASNDLSQYKELAGDNIQYDASEKRYLPTAQFRPRFMKPSADRYLSQLKAVADGVVTRDETLIEGLPSVDSMPIPGRRIEPATLKALLAAIRSNRSVEIHYQSMNPKRPEAVWRRITPHAFGHDGLRWHTRAFCHMEKKFKDFIVSRCRAVRGDAEPGARPSDDKQWHTTFETVLIPNPALTPSQQQTIALDYEMTDGRAALPIRCALLYYFEKRLRLDMEPGKDKPAEKPVVIENWREFVRARDAAMAWSSSATTTETRKGGEMIVGEMKQQIDSIWKDFWSGGLSNPLAVIEQITYLLFIKRLDELHTLEEGKAAGLKLKTLERRIFPEGKDGLRNKIKNDEGVLEDDGGRKYEDLRWSRFKHFEPKEMFEVVDEHVFPFIREQIAKDGAVAKHMREARFGIPTPALLAKVVDKLDKIEMVDRDTKGDVYEYMLGQIASAGQNGQFRTPRHIIKLMVELTKPTPTDVICDPAAGTCGFLVAAGEYLREHHKGLFRDEKLRRHFHETAFHGFDFDPTMLRIGSMNMILHGIENPMIVARDSLSEDIATEKERYSLILANPPFAGSLDYESTAKDLQQIVKTKKTELLFLALFLRLLKTGGRAAVIVPDGVLFGSSTAHKALRKALVEEHKLEAVIKLPSGVFRPYAGVSTAILLFTKTGVGGTDDVWFYDVQADGQSLDDKRTALLPEEKLGPTPSVELTDNDYAKNNLPDVLARWESRHVERERPRTEQSFLVSRSDIAAQGYDLSLNRYKVVVHEQIDHRAPREIIAELKALEADISKGLAELEGMVR